MNTINEDTFEQLSKDIHNVLGLFHYTEEFDKLNEALMIGINVDIENNKILNWSKIDSQPDVYDLMVSENAPSCKDYEIIALLTSGWAAPVDKDDDIAPSKHPLRKRVYLSLIGNTPDQISSVVAMEGEDELMYEYNSGSGFLMESFIRFMGKI